MTKPIDAATADRFGLLIALLTHHMSDDDDVPIDLSKFPALVLRIFDKSKTVLQKRFDGEVAKFYNVLFIRVFLAKVEEDIEMLAIEQWLDTELREAGIHPREFN